MDFHSMGAQLRRNDGVPMHIESPTGDPLFAKKDSEGKWTLGTNDADGDPCRLMIVGQDSKQFRQRKAELFRMSQKFAGKKMKFTQAEEEDLKTVASAIVGWENVIWPNDEGEPEPMPFTEENLLTFLNGYPAGMDQANRFIADRANFFEPATTG